MKVKNKQDIFKQIEENKEQILSYGIGKIGLFGSFIRNRQKARSDVDLVIEFIAGKKNYRNYIGFAEFIEKLFRRKVEIITPESISSYIAPYIKKEVKYVQIAN